MAELKRFNRNTSFDRNTIADGDVFPFQHNPNQQGDVDGKITTSELKHRMTDDITPISEIDTTSSHPVDSTAVETKLDEYQKKLTAGKNISITEDNKINVDLSSVYKYKGSVDTYDELPTENLEVGWVYDVKDTDINYAWNGEKWDALGSYFKLEDESVTTAKLAKNSVSSEKLQDKVVSEPKLSERVLCEKKLLICNVDAGTANKEILNQSTYLYEIESDMIFSIMFMYGNTVSSPYMSFSGSNYYFCSSSTGSAISQHEWDAGTVLDCIKKDGRIWILGHPLVHLDSDGNAYFI